MSESKSRKNKTETKADYYTPVIIGQFIICLILSGAMWLFFSSGTDTASAVRERLSALLSEDIPVSVMVNRVLSFTDAKSNAAFQDDTVTYTADYAMGGDDLEYYKATEKTSFAPFVTTDTVLNPIENGRYTSYFGYRTNPITGEWSFHTGLDIAADEGTPIRAALKGKVTKTGEDDRAGKYVFITHSDGFVTFYCHCSEILVEEGMQLNRGETVARVGSTGWSTGPHLHFEFRRNNIRLNPMWVLADDC